MTTDVPILVVGGGPAGAVTALLLARRGWEVELVDRSAFPRPKACGECLNPAGVALLARLRLLDPVLATDPVELCGWDLGSPGTGSVPARFAAGDRALGIERKTFDAVLLEAARCAGVTVREGVRLLDATPGGATEPARVRLRRPGGAEEERSCRLLVGADGLHSRLAACTGMARPPGTPRKASLTWRIEGRGPSRDRGRLIIGDGITVGLAPVGNRASARWNATLVVTSGSPAAPRGAAALGRDGWHLLRTFLPLDMERTPPGAAPWTVPPHPIEGPWGAGSFHRPVPVPARGRALLVGDAAGYFDPLTGQGIFRALRSAELAAEAVERHLCDRCARLLEADQAAPRAYGRSLRRALAPGRWLQRGVEGVVTRPWALRAALTAFGRAPFLASGLVRCIGDRPTTLLHKTTPPADSSRPTDPERHANR